MASRVILAATALALARAVLIALKDEYLAAGLWQLGARALGRGLLEGFATCLVPIAALGLASAFASARRLRGVLAAALAACLLGAYSFVAFRLPPDAFYAPRFDGPTAYAAHGAALAAAFVATSILAPFVRMPFARALALAAVLVVLVPAGALQLWPGDARGDARPNVVLISVDTLRADRLGCYGYPKGTSPEIDRFAREAVVFTTAYSPQPFTLTAHMSMLTSLYPTSHGVSTTRSLSQSVPTMASLLAREGYATLAVVDVAHWMSPSFGFDRGFDLYHVMPNRAEIKVDGILSLLDDLGRRPFFLFAHFYDVHSDKTRLPYEADPEDVESFAGWYAGGFTGCDERDCASELLYAMGERDEVLAGEDREYVSSLYDAGVRSLDRELGRLFEGLAERGLLETSAVLLTSDHGEEFFEHGKAMHTQSFDECLRVPFVLRPPRGRAGTSDVLVSLVDVAPTLLAFCGVELESAQGVSLAAIGTGAAGDAPATTRRHVLIDGRARQRGLRTERWSLVPTAGRLAVFDARADPGQENELPFVRGTVDDASELQALLEAEIEALYEARRRFGAGVDRPLPDGAAEALRELGYAGE